MSFFKTDKTADATSEFEGTGGGKYISTSGMFPVTVLAPFVSNGNDKATTIDLFVDYNEQQQAIYGNMSYTNKDGGANKIGQEIFNKLVILADVEDVSDPVDMELPIGKKDANKTVAVLEDLMDVDVIMQVRMEYGVWNNNITKKTVIKSFFRASDNASVAEILADEEGKEVVFGTQYATIAEGADYVDYKDGLDEEKVQAWIKAKWPKGTGTSGSTASATATKKPSFGRKK